MRIPPLLLLSFNSQTNVSPSIRKCYDGTVRKQRLLFLGLGSSSSRRLNARNIIFARDIELPALGARKVPVSKPFTTALR